MSALNIVVSCLAVGGWYAAAVCWILWRREVRECLRRMKASIAENNRTLRDIEAHQGGLFPRGEGRTPTGRVPIIEWMDKPERTTCHE